jgi:hypothetical protein
LIEYIPAIHGPYAVVAVTAEGEFILGRFHTPAARDQDYYGAYQEHCDDIDAVLQFDTYTISYSDDVISIEKRNFDFDPSNFSAAYEGSLPVPPSEQKTRRRTRRRKDAPSNS